MTTQPGGVGYGGRSFESVLKARWAVFFDSLGVPWEYQKETFNLPYGGLFTPDFWLPLHQCWLVAYPSLPDEQALTQTADLSFATRRWVYVVWGEIGEHVIYAFDLPFYEQGYDKRYVFTLSDDGEELMVSGPLRGDDEYQLIGYSYKNQQAVLQKSDNALSNPRLLAAYDAARSARFT